MLPSQRPHHKKLKLYDIDVGKDWYQCNTIIGIPHCHFVQRRIMHVSYGQSVHIL